MAVTTSRNLKLKIDSNLTANAKYNLQRIDELGAVYLLDNTETVNIRSKVNINLRPEDASVGGSGTGGTVSLGASGQPLDIFRVYADEIYLSGLLNLEDQASGSDKQLQMRYKSDLNGSADNAANRTLSIDVDEADRELVLGGNFRTTGGNLVLTMGASSSVNVPASGTLATLAGSETLTNKLIDAASNTISNLANANISASAAIAYSKLNLASSIVNADINASAAIAYSKLNLASSIVNADVSNSAAIAYSKLNLAGSILNADINASAGITYSKLDLGLSIVNADISPTAAISGSKIAPDFGSQNIQTSGELRLEGPSFYTGIRADQSSQVANLLFTLPPDDGTSGQVLRTDGSGNLSWVTPAGGAGTNETSETWTSGTSKTVTHNWGTRKIIVQVLDGDNNYINVSVDSIERPTDNTVVLTSTEAPSNWLVLLKEVP